MNSRKPSRPRQPTPRPVPIERGRAAGVLGGLFAFCAGFAAAGLLVVTGYGRTPPYLVAITVGLVGIGAMGYFYHRGNATLPEAAIWSPTLLRAVVVPLGLPALPTIALLYVLGAVGLLGNLIVPVILR